MSRYFTRVALSCALILFSVVTAHSQSWSSPRTWSTGELVSASIMNSAIRDNLSVLRGGGFAVTSQAIGDLLCASSTTQFARLAGVATGQVLKSGGVGACPAYGTINVAFLSDASNVALLNAANTFTAATQTWSISGSATQKWAVGVSGGNTYLYGYSGTQKFLRHSSGANAILSGGATGLQFIDAAEATVIGSLSDAGLLTVSGGLSLANGTGINEIAFTGADFTNILSATTAGMQMGITGATGALSLLTNNAVRWGINAAGDWTFGTSSNIADSNGTPVCTSCAGGSVAGTDYAMVYAGAAGSHGGPTITFGHTFANAPVCVANQSVTGGGSVQPILVATTTTTVTLTYAANGSGESVNILCRGY